MAEQRPTGTRMVLTLFSMALLGAVCGFIFDLSTISSSYSDESASFAGCWIGLIISTLTGLIFIGKRYFGAHTSHN